jgi:hypothetical protein
MQIAQAITFDMEWAPDWAIVRCNEICRRAGAAATFFVTHQCDALADLRREGDRVELGIHPNFMAHSTHGSTTESVLANCMGIVPEAKSMRTHSLVQSTRIFEVVAERTTIEVDTSTLLAFHQGLQATELYVGNPVRRLIMLPFLFEDNLMAEWPNWSWTESVWPTNGLAIFNFHPLLIAMNLDRIQRYYALKEYLGARNPSTLTEKEFQRFVNEGVGARTYLDRVLSSRPVHSFQTVSQIAADRPKVPF